MWSVGDKIEPDFILSYDLGYGSMKSIDSTKVDDSITTFTLLYDEAEMPYICGLNADGILVSVAKVPEGEPVIPRSHSLDEYAKVCQVNAKTVHSIKKDVLWVFLGIVLFLAFIGVCST